MRKVNKIVVKGCILILIVLSVFRIMAFSHLIEESLRYRIYLILTSLIFIPFIFNIFLCTGKELKYAIKTNIFVILYLTMSIIFVINNKSQAAIETIIYEMYYLAVGFVLIKSVKNLDVAFKVFIVLITLLNLLTVFIYFFMQSDFNSTTDTIFNFVYKYTLYKSYPYSSLYTNPNYAGVVTAISILMSINYFKKKGVLFWSYIGFSICFIHFQRCRSAQLALIICLFCYVVNKFWKRPKLLISITLMLCIFASIGISFFAYSHSQKKSDVFYLTEFETQLNKVSSSRYIIWKMDLFASREKLMFGTGSLQAEKDYRNQIIKSFYPKEKAEELIAAKHYINAHNGYLGTAIVRGIVGLILFLMILLNRIWIMEKREVEKWYLCINLILIVNIFESYFITETFVGCFLLMLFLARGSVENFRSKNSKLK